MRHHLINELGHLLEDPARWILEIEFEVDGQTIRVSLSYLGNHIVTVIPSRRSETSQERRAEHVPVDGYNDRIATDRRPFRHLRRSRDIERAEHNARVWPREFSLAGVRTVRCSRTLLFSAMSSASSSSSVRTRHCAIRTRVFLGAFASRGVATRRSNSERFRSFELVAGWRGLCTVCRALRRAPCVDVERLWAEATTDAPENTRPAKATRATILGRTTVCPSANQRAERTPHCLYSTNVVDLGGPSRPTLQVTLV